MHNSDKRITTFLGASERGVQTQNPARLCEEFWVKFKAHPLPRLVFCWAPLEARHYGLSVHRIDRRSERAWFWEARREARLAARQGARQVASQAFLGHVMKTCLLEASFGLTVFGILTGVSYLMAALGRACVDGQAGSRPIRPPRPATPSRVAWPARRPEQPGGPADQSLPCGSQSGSRATDHSPANPADQSDTASRRLSWPRP